MPGGGGARVRTGAGSQRGSRVQQWRRGMDLPGVVKCRSPGQFVCMKGSGCEG
jgi:hypothetical protein